MIRIVLASAILVAILPVSAKTPRDTFVVAANLSQMITLDPAATNESFTAGILRNVCDALIAIDPADSSKLVPGVAESWTVSADGVRFAFKIHESLRFPSGNPVTAEDIVWSIKRNLHLNL